MPFLTPHLDTRHNNDRAGQLFTLLAPVTYITDKGDVITVRPGFRTDMATIKRPATCFFTPWGTYARSAVVHDLLCWAIEQGAPVPCAPDFRTAAHLFHEMMVAEGVGQFIRATLFAWVYAWAVLVTTLGLRTSTPGVGYPTTHP